MKTTPTELQMVAIYKLIGIQYEGRDIIGQAEDNRYSEDIHTNEHELFIGLIKIKAPIKIAVRRFSPEHLGDKPTVVWNFLTSDTDSH